MTIRTLETRNLCDSARNGGCGECQTSCQSACKTSCGIANQQCENKQDKSVSRRAKMPPLGGILSLSRKWRCHFPDR